MRKTRQLKDETMTAAEREKIGDLHDLAFEAMKVAVRKALREKRRLGLPIWVMRNGKVTNINPKKRGGKTKKKRARDPKARPHKPRTGHATK